MHPTDDRCTGILYVEAQIYLYIKNSYTFKPKSLPLQLKITSILESSFNQIIAGDLHAIHTSWNNRSHNRTENTLEYYFTIRSDSIFAAPNSSTHFPDNLLHKPNVLVIAIMETGNLDEILQNLMFKLYFDHSSILIDIRNGFT